MNYFCFFLGMLAGAASVILFLWAAVLFILWSDRKALEKENT